MSPGANFRPLIRLGRQLISCPHRVEGGQIRNGGREDIGQPAPPGSIYSSAEVLGADGKMPALLSSSVNSVTALVKYSTSVSLSWSSF